jgi:hypothetical protein
MFETLGLRAGHVSIIQTGKTAVHYIPRNQSITKIKLFAKTVKKT